MRRGPAVRAVKRALAALALGLLGSAAAAQPDLFTIAADALTADAAGYAKLFDVPIDEAASRLRAQEASVAATDAIAATYRDRLAGIAIEHAPDYRIVVLLTGDEPVPDQTIVAGGRNVQILFRTGAKATRDQVLGVITAHQAELRQALHDPPGLGLDPRTGELVAVVSIADAQLFTIPQIRAGFEQVTGVPVRVRTLRPTDVDLAVSGGGRLSGIDPADGKRYACTAGFVVTDGMQTGLTTAAHCPDNLDYIDAAGTRTSLSFVNGWGARYQDVQIHLADQPLEPLFYADTAKTMLRPVTSWRNHASTRAGDVVCHRGERSGYSCAQVEFVDYAPPGDLCAGPCPADWVAVAGPSCNRGDSGGPVFLGTIAFGIVKGGSYRSDGTCNFYYYMSTDYLPPPWTLAHR